jgi:hypothetical protein
MLKQAVSRMAPVMGRMVVGNGPSEFAIVCALVPEDLGTVLFECR